MSVDTLAQVKNLIDQLSPLEQAQLLEYLKPKGDEERQPDEDRDAESAREKSVEKFRRLRDQLIARQTGKGKTSADTGISLEEAFRRSDELATGAGSNPETMTQEFLRTRR